jgi:hypothetical protein
MIRFWNRTVYKNIHPSLLLPDYMARMVKVFCKPAWQYVQMEPWTNYSLHTPRPATDNKIQLFSHCVYMYKELWTFHLTWYDNQSDLRESLHSAWSHAVTLFKDILNLLHVYSIQGSKSVGTLVFYFTNSQWWMQTFAQDWQYSEMSCIYWQQLWNTQITSLIMIINRYVILYGEWEGTCIIYHYKSEKFL